MDVGFTGTQRGMTALQSGALVAWLDQLAARSVLDGGDGAIRLHHGDCVGADAEAVWAAHASGVAPTLVAHPPSNPAKRAWTSAHETRPVAEYLVRNQQLVDESHVLLAAPSGFSEETRSGTWATVRYARRVDVPRLLLWPDGRVEWEVAR